MIVITALFSFSCQQSPKEVDQVSVKEFFSKHRVGQSPDYAVIKNGKDHLLTIHGYANDLDVCLRLIEPYNRDSSLSVTPGSYECVPLNR